MVPNVHLSALGIRGFSGRPVQEVISMAHRMLGYCSSRTLEYYAGAPDRYPSLGFTPEQVSRYYQPDIAVTFGTMTKRPYDNGRWPRRHTDGGTEDAAAHRFESGFGVLVSGDFIGGYECGGYGAIDKAAIFVDHGHRPPFVRAGFYKKNIKDVAAVALKEMVQYWERHGHHESAWHRPIAEFRSDSGAFTSDATSNLCRDFKIVQSFSTPGAQGQNPAEATIRRIFELVTTCFAGAPWVPRMLWTYCLAYVVHCRNLKVIDLEQGPSYEAFHSEFYDFNARPLLPFGQPVVVFIDKDHRHWKFGPHALMAMFVGSPEGIKNAIMVFNPITGKVRITRDYMVVDKSAVPAYWPTYETKDSTFHPVDHDPAYPNAREDTLLPVLTGDPMADPLQEVPFDVPIAVRQEFRPAIEEVGMVVAPLPVVQDATESPAQVADLVADKINSALIPERNEDVGAIIDLSEVIPESIDFSMETLCFEEVDISNRVYIRKVAGSRRAMNSKWFADRLRIQEKEIKAKRHLRCMFGHVRRNGKPKIRSVDNPSLKQALNGPYRQMVLDAMNAELTQYIDTYGALEVFSSSDISSMSRFDKSRAITTHFEIEYKRDKKTGDLLKVKARLVIHGNQDDKYQWDAIKSPTARSASVKLLMAILAKRLSKDRQFTARAYDVPGAFLHSNIEESDRAKTEADPSYVPGPPIIVRLPDGRFGRLTAYAYGLRQASFEFYTRCKKAMASIGFMSTCDPCLFVKWVGRDAIIAAAHVDDFFVVSTSEVLHQQLDTHFTETFGQRLTRKVGPDISYQGMVVQHREDGSVFVNQPSYVKDKIIEEWAFKTGWINRADVGVTDHPMQASQSHLEGDDDPVDSTVFRGAVGAISYLAQMTRPDLLYAVSIVASKCQNPTVFDHRIVKRILRYIIGTADHGLTFSADSDFQLVGHADASFASRDLSRSQSGYCFSLGKNNGSFYSRSSKQSLVTLSSTEAEYVSLFHCSTEAVFLRRLLEELGFRQNPTTIYQDNISTIHWSNGRDNFHRTKHMDVKYHYVRQLVSDHAITVVYLPTEQMIADVLTKPVLKDKFSWLAAHLLGSS